MSTKDLHLLEKLAKSELKGTLADHPEIQSLFRNMGYELRSTSPVEGLEVIARRILGDR